MSRFAKEKGVIRGNCIDEIRELLSPGLALDKLKVIRKRLYLGRPQPLDDPSVDWFLLVGSQIDPLMILHDLTESLVFGVGNLGYRSE